MSAKVERLSAALSQSYRMQVQLTSAKEDSMTSVCPTETRNPVNLLENEIGHGKVRQFENEI